VPSNINFSLFDAVDTERRLKKSERKEYYCNRAKEEIENFLPNRTPVC